MTTEAGAATTRYCTSCGAEVGARSRFCGTCGAPFKAASPTSTETTEASAPTTATTGIATAAANGVAPSPLTGASLSDTVLSPELNPPGTTFDRPAAVGGTSGGASGSGSVPRPETPARVPGGGSPPRGGTGWLLRQPVLLSVLLLVLIGGGGAVAYGTYQQRAAEQRQLEEQRVLQEQRSAFSAGEEAVRQENWEAAAAAFRKAGSYQDARQRAESAAAKAAEEAARRAELERRYAAASGAMAGGRFSEALDLWQKVLEIDRNYRDAAAQLTNARGRAQQSLFDEGEAALAVLDFGAAQARFETLRGIAPSFPNLPDRLYAAYLGVARATAPTDARAALTFYDQVIAIRDNDSQVRQERTQLNAYLQAVAAYDRSQWEQVINGLRSLPSGYLDVADKLYATHVNYGRALLNERRMTDAQRQAESAVALNASRSEGRALLADIRRVFFVEMDALLARYQILRDRQLNAYVAYRTGRSGAGPLETELIYQIAQRQEIRRAVNALTNTTSEPVLRSLISDLSAVLEGAVQTSQLQRDTLSAIVAGRGRNDDRTWEAVESLGDRTTARRDTFDVNYARAKQAFLS